MRANKKPKVGDGGLDLSDIDSSESEDEGTAAKGDKDSETMVVQLQSIGTTGEDENNSEKKLPQIDVPLSATTLQLERLVNQLLSNDEKVPYAFYVMSEDTSKKQVEIVGSLRETIESNGIGTENILEIKYQPLSLFRVHPVTRCTDSLPGHTDSLLHVSFSPDGERLASGGGDTTVRFWNVSTRTPRHVCRGHKNHVLCTAWSPDGKRFASGDKNGKLVLWDPNSGEAVGRPFNGHKQWITSLSWEPHHRNAACERLLSGSKDKTARIWNVRTGRSIMTLAGHEDSIESVRWGGEGCIYTASRDKTIMVWVERTGSDGNSSGSHPFKLARTLKGHAHRVNFIALSTDYLCRTGAFDHTGSLVKKNELEIEKQLKQDGQAGRDAALKRYNEAKKNFGTSVPFERLVSCSDDFTLFLWHPTDDKKPVQRMLGHQQPVTHLSFSPDGKYLASASFDKKVKLWCGRTGNFMATLTGHVGHVYQVCWAPDSRLLASASKDSTLKVWEVRYPKKPKSTLSGHYDEIYALDWSPNGALIASGGKDRILKIWTS